MFLIIREQKRVPINSEEAKRYLESQNKNNNSNNNNNNNNDNNDDNNSNNHNNENITTNYKNKSEVNSNSSKSSFDKNKPSLSAPKKPRSAISEAIAKRGRFGRPKSNLSEIAASLKNKPQKINTLEKSKMDWNKYVDKEGLVDELKYHNKNG